VVFCFRFPLTSPCFPSLCLFLFDNNIVKLSSVHFFVVVAHNGGQSILINKHIFIRALKPVGSFHLV
jgi:hypothetical protein